MGSASIARDVNALTSDRSPQIGDAYQSEKESFVGQACLGGVRVPTGVATSTFNFEQSLSERQASEQLGFQAGLRARYGVVEGTASARFMKSAVSSAYSISSVWLSEYHLPADKLSSIALSPIGEAVKSNYERWAKTCGDEYIDEITRGAKLFFSVRLDFSSKEQKQAFEAKFSINGPLFGANASLEQASRDFSKDAKVVVSAFQVGGDVSKLTAVLGDQVGRVGFVECTLGDFGKCSQIIKSALAYAADVQQGFPSQIAPGVTPGAAPILYRTAPYTSVGIYPQNYPHVEEATRLARERLAKSFEQQFAWAVQADRLMSMGLGKEQHSAVSNAKSVIDGNISKILEASKVCYDTPVDCFKAVAALTLLDVDETALQLPPLPTASYRLYTNSRGLLSRSESLETIKHEVKDRWILDKNGLWVQEPLEDIHESAFHDLSLLNSPSDRVSVALAINGAALQKAVLYFENRKLREFPLTKGSSEYDEKYGDTYVLLILETTQDMPGWRDIDIAKERLALQTKDFPRAQGRFYVKVADGFSRETSFDIAYQSWNRTELSDGRVQTTLWSRRNWWVDGPTEGTNAALEDGWSDIVNASFISLPQNAPYFEGR
jgi:hypothetical protein